MVSTSIETALLANPMFSLLCACTAKLLVACRRCEWRGRSALHARGADAVAVCARQGRRVCACARPCVR
eukprot:6189125-Pleurochrysis_carterae.AAC.3